jgi:transcriptional regulator with XRE-family HTH domain
MDMKTLEETLPKALRFLRQKEGCTQEAVATKAGITSSMVSNYERGKEKPSLVTLFKVLCAVDADLTDLGEAMDVLSEYWSDHGKRERRKSKREEFFALLDGSLDDFQRPSRLKSSV